MSEQTALVPMLVASAASASAAEKRGRRLSSLSNIKAALADVYRKQEDGELNANEARARVYTLAEIAKIIQGGETERRLAALELAEREH